jgi:hypothetical protein
MFIVQATLARILNYNCNLFIVQATVTRIVNYNCNMFMILATVVKECCCFCIQPNQQSQQDKRGSALLITISSNTDICIQPSFNPIKLFFVVNYSDIVVTSVKRNLALITPERFDRTESRGQSYKTFYGSNLGIFVIS